MITMFKRDVLSHAAYMDTHPMLIKQAIRLLIALTVRAKTVSIASKETRILMFAQNALMICLLILISVFQNVQIITTKMVQLSCAQDVEQTAKNVMTMNNALNVMKHTLFQMEYASLSVL